MNTSVTAGAWRVGALRASSSTWPFEWVGEITAIDPESRRHECIGRFVQSGARPKAEARANLTAFSRVPAMLRMLDAVVGVIDMSDPEHESFADSAADCLDALLQHAAELRALLAELRPLPGLQRVPAT